MTLPKIDLPIFQVTLPSNQKEISFRPFLVKEEKLLLMAVESDNENEIIIITNCDIFFDYNWDFEKFYDILDNNFFMVLSNSGKVVLAASFVGKIKIGSTCS